MGWFSKKTETQKLNWEQLKSQEDLDFYVQKSHEQKVLILKHSTRCSISFMAKGRLEDQWEDTLDVVPVYLDLISYRDVSNEIADRFNVIHQSPQVILLDKGEAVYSASHNEISVSAIKKQLA